MISDHPLPHVASQAFRPGHSGPDPETSTQIIVVHVHQQGSKGYKKLRKAIKDLKEILMATAADFAAGFARIDTATTAIADLLRQISTQVGSMTKDEEEAAKAKLNSIADTLEAMAANPVNPVPVPVPTP